MIYAGADNALTPHMMGGMRMAQMVLRPTVINFLDMAMHDQDLDLLMEELPVSPDSELAGRNLIESNLRPEYNLIIIAIKKQDGRMIYNPQPTEVIHQGDTLIVVGKNADLERAEQIL